MGLLFVFGGCQPEADSTSNPEAAVLCGSTVCTPCERCEDQACVPLEEGESCNDGLFCTVNESCVSGACVGDSIDCSASDSECAVGLCNENFGRCELQVDEALDTDLDGICNAEDLCPGFNDKSDADQDSIPDACDQCDGLDDTLKLAFDWPMAGQAGEDWIISNYLDHDPTTGTDAKRDHLGHSGDLAKTYDGHKGIDISIANFRAMDANFPVYAAESGVVESMRDGNIDDNSIFNPMCTYPANFVEIRHASGALVRYYHFKKNSIVVKEGDQIQSGDLLGMAGSSGCSSWPHLHFEVWDCNDQVVDPFLTGLWKAPPAYDPPLGLMDIVVKKDSFPTNGDLTPVRDPLPNVTSFALGDVFGFSVTTGGGVEGDQVKIELRRPNDSLFTTLEATYQPHPRRIIWWWSRTLPTDGADAGEWKAQVQLNDVPKRTYPFQVTP